MDSHLRLKPRLYLVRPHPNVVRRNDTYSGEWTQVREGLLGWKLLNWLAERPVPLYVVGEV